MTLTHPLSACIAGIGVIGPGFDDWAGARDVLAGTVPFVSTAPRIPVPMLLPSVERRRVGAVVKLALGVGMQAVEAAGADAAQLVTVFASSGGDGDNCHAICESLAGDDRLLSPTRFHNSVNNAASGYWSIATGAHAASTIVSAYDGSFAAGLLEALSQLRASGAPVLLVAYEHPYPAPLAATRPMAEAFATALLLAPENDANRPRIALAGFTASAADTLPDPNLERLRLGIPAARSLPLLARIARCEAATTVIEYLDGSNMAVDLTP